ncbi:23S rRNA (adenine(2030)-N(6))-methyltransferase RlmJ [Mesorhizobium sp. Mes31]|uniref:23S rRNA (adenine(2030)-N(6))-methyltransferase RlmJ n=1 Tax=Mesorhizobium sp. Mes31 TaxID=2926017 RepID=UPI002119887C|nr:23S rRNA (adenine(2030)-N(6))-methyltransferase RlmJ [Mesorhizobium sp. Mes31]
MFKHAALTIILERLIQKVQPFMVLDTHAGVGLYDLSSDEANRTGEKEYGVGRMFGKPLASAPAYAKLLGDLNRDGLRTYPGSPEIIRNMLRNGDRLVACELHPEDGELLQKRYRRDRRVTVQLRDGYEVVGALLPPPERRGLVFIDPPFEQKDETKHLANVLRKGAKKWATGIFLVWYPIKDSTIGDAVAKAAVSAGFNKILRAEFAPFLRDGARLAGSGFVICNTPWTVDDRLRNLCHELTPLLGGANTTWSVEWLTGRN